MMLISKSKISVLICWYFSMFDLWLKKGEKCFQYGGDYVELKVD